MIATRKDRAVLVRFPRGMLAHLDAAAKKNGRSRNSEILVYMARCLELDVTNTSVSKQKPR